MISGRVSSSPRVDMGQGSFSSASSFSVLTELDVREERVDVGAWGEGCQELCTTSNISLILLAPTTSPAIGRKMNELFSLIIHTN